MRLTNKITNTIALIFFVAAITLIFSTCKPAIGTPWYPRSTTSSSADFVITRIQVKGMDVVPVLAETPTGNADKLKKFSEAKNYTVNVPPEITEITGEDITVTAVSSLSKMESITVEVTLNGGSIPLSAGQVVPVTIKVADPAGNYTVQEKVLSITQREPYDLELKSLIVCGRDASQGNITVPYTVTAISAKDITATFAYGPHTTIIPVELDKPSIKLYEDEEKEITISIKEKKGQYHAFSQTITVTRERKPDDADPVLEPESIFILGIRYEVGKPLGVPMDTQRLTEADVVTVFKDFGELPVTLNPNPAEFGGADSIELKLSIPSQAGKYVGWETAITVKKDPTALNNPKDKNGNKKYIVKVKTITETVSPFDFYKQDYEFPASKFDEWVLVMPSMSGIIASYKFQPGSWSGSPEMIDNIPSGIGSGLKAISNVKIYRYKTRADRWRASNGYVPAGDPNDSRFYFYRFTADASAGVKSDNSMFCVDRYSKFLFYYSDPAVLKTIVPGTPPVPQDWTDYAAPSKGEHHQFDKPFYMSDPVGYVKADGSVVIYSWLKDNINNAKYHAQKNSAYTKPAGRSPGKAGYSPYRDNIINKRNEVETTVNPAYTVAVPVILGQPRAVRVPRNTAADKAFFMVKTAPAPEGEQLSYQWYTNTTQSNEGGMPISSATNAVYTPDTSAETDCFVYCEVTNTNGSNNQTETVKSDAVKLLISDGSLAVDAEQPRIVRQPVGKVIPINTSGDTAKVTLTVEAVSLDKGVISYQWYRNPTNIPEISDSYAISGATEASYSFTADTSSVKNEYYYCKVTNTNKNAEGKKTAFRVTDTAEVKVEELYKVYFDKEGNGSITAIYGQKLIETGDYVKKGETVRFLAQADAGYEVQQWDGNLTEIAENKLSASITVTKQETVKVVIRKVPDTRKLTITAKKIVNKDLGGRDYIVSFINGDAVHFAYFIYNFRARIFENDAKKGNFTSLWSKLNGRDLAGWEQVNLAEWLYTKGHGPYLMLSDEGTQQSVMKDFATLPDQQYFQLDTKVVKYDRYHYGRFTNTQFISKYEQSIMDFEYHKSDDEWVYRKAEYDIPNVTITLPENFVLKRGQAKEFTISYYVDNSGNQAVGTVEVTYTLKWE